MNPQDFLAQVQSLLAAHPDGVLPIVQAGQPVLREVTAPYDGQLGDLLSQFLQAMYATMMDAPGVGLAATQIGVGLSVAVMWDPGSGDDGDTRERTAFEPRFIFNPAYTPVGDRLVTHFEGCLSVDGYQAAVTRPHSVRLTGTDENGVSIDEVLTGWPARIAQHEIDHLNGVLYVDRAQMRSLCTTQNLSDLWSFSSEPAAAARALDFDVAQGLDAEQNTGHSIEADLGEQLDTSLDVSS